MKRYFWDVNEEFKNLVKTAGKQIWLVHDEGTYLMHRDNGKNTVVYATKEREHSGGDDFVEYLPAKSFKPPKDATTLCIKLTTKHVKLSWL